MLERVRHMLVKEFIQIFRDPKMRGVIFVIPVVQTLVFGYAVTTDVKHLKTTVLDRDLTVASRELLASFAASEYFDLVGPIPDADEARRWIDRGKAQVFIEIPEGFQADLETGRPAPVQVILDGTDSNTAGIAMNYARTIVARYARSVQPAELAAGAAAAPEAPVALAPRTWFNENLESRNFYVPGVIALLVTLITLLLTSMAVVREKEIGTIEQIVVTPITPLEFILGKTVPFALIGFFDVILITVIAATWFDIPIRGSLELLVGATALYLLTTLGIGLLISTVSGTQQQAMMTTFFFYFPAVLLSGFMFPIANMPVAVQAVTLLNPLRYFLVIIRGIFLKGVGMEVLWPQFAVLAVMGAAAVGVTSRRFKKTLA